MDSSNTSEVTSDSESLANLMASNPVQLNNRDIYQRIASNIELIGLYVQINEQILAEPEGPNRHSRLFRSLTA